MHIKAIAPQILHIYPGNMPLVRERSHDAFSPHRQSVHISNVLVSYGIDTYLGREVEPQVAGLKGVFDKKGNLAR